ncbi:MAG TPA: DUF1508 domain-containing protein [Solirubrobacteraceae bacterium]|nr:DUF1508 domain-containing protein [Solirubrobacteraceae bacterium]
MATATKNRRFAKRIDGRTSAVSGSAAMEFRTFEDNGGRYHWTIVDGAGQPLVSSEGFASYDEAERAARAVREGAGTARFERRGPDAPLIDLAARRAARSEDDSDPERWLDEGGSFSSEAVTEWPAPR